MPKTPLLLTFSGLDGAGKSTQIAHLTAWLEAGGARVVCLWARGGYTPGFEWLKSILRRLLGRRLPAPGASPDRSRRLARPRVAGLWLALAMLDLMLYWGLYLRYQRWRGRVVICDRYLDDTRLDFRRNFPAVAFERSMLWRLLEWLTPRADAAFLLWVPVAESRRRSIVKGEPFPDDEATLSWRLAAYLDASVFPPTHYLRCDCLDPPEVVSSAIIARVAGLRRASDAA